MNFNRLFLFCAALIYAVPVAATLPGLSDVQEPTGSASEPDSTIAQSAGAGDDARITERIEGIFAELPGFDEILVRTNDGVVSLSGTLPDAEAIARAENIAGRVAGVVTVESDLKRDLSVGENLSVFGEFSGFLDGFIAALPLFAVAVLVALLFGFAGLLLSRLTFIWDRITPNLFLSELLASAIRFVFILGGIVIALDMIGAGALLGAVLGGAGVIGIALGFAMRDTIENYVASLMLSLRQPFRPNDHVLIDDLEGHVIRLTSRATILMTLEGNHLRIPNSQVFKAVILNYTRNPQRRFEFELGIDADDDPRAAMNLGRKTLEDLTFVETQPEPAARITQVGDSNIGILFLGWVDQREADWGKSRSIAIAAVKDALEESGFALPEPIYRLRFDGRTDPLPIGRSSAKTTTVKPQRQQETAAADPQHEDVEPESEIRHMVETERQGDDEQGADLLDTSRPVE